MIAKPVSDTAKTPELDIRLSRAVQRPRFRGGTNSEIMP
jgi:hypothetical protein